jgi:hypothetical protein
VLEECNIEVKLLDVVLVNLDVNDKRSLHTFFAPADLSNARTMEDEVVHVEQIDVAISDAKAHPERYAGDFLDAMRMVEKQIAFLRAKAASASAGASQASEIPPDSRPVPRRPRP